MADEREVLRRKLSGRILFLFLFSFLIFFVFTWKRHLWHHHWRKLKWKKIAFKEKKEETWKRGRGLGGGGGGQFEINGRRKWLMIVVRNVRYFFVSISNLFLAFSCPSRTIRMLSVEIVTEFFCFVFHFLAAVVVPTSSMKTTPTSLKK